MTREEQLAETLYDTLAHFESLWARVEDGQTIYPADRIALAKRFDEAHALLRRSGVVAHG